MVSHKIILTPNYADLKISNWGEIPVNNIFYHRQLFDTRWRMSPLILRAHIGSMIYDMDRGHLITSLIRWEGGSNHLYKDINDLIHSL